MSGVKYKYDFHKLRIFNFQEYSKKIIFCQFIKPEIKKIKIANKSQSYFKTKKINELISNIYIYKFPPLLNWPEGLCINISVDFVIAVRKIFEHSSEIILNNIKELCFSLNADYSSYGNKIIIIPVEFITNNYDKRLFFDVFAHETGHALAEEVFKDRKLCQQIQAWHKIIKYYSLKFNEDIFYDPGISKLSLAKYQLEDYREFFSELFSQILNYYNDLINHVCKIKFQEAQFAYLSMIELMMNYVTPFSPEEKQKLIINL